MFGNIFLIGRSARCKTVSSIPKFFLAVNSSACRLIMRVWGWIRGKEISFVGILALSSSVFVFVADVPYPMFETRFTVGFMQIPLFAAQAKTHCASHIFIF